MIKKIPLLNNIVIYLDRLDFLICWLVIKLTRKISRQNNFVNPKNIILLRNCFFGDFIVSIPAIKLLKAKFPNSKIILLTSKSFNKDALKFKRPDGIYNLEKNLLDEIIEYDNSIMKSFNQYLKLKKKLSFYKDISVVDLDFSGAGFRRKLKRIILCFGLKLPQPFGNLKNKPLIFQESLNKYRINRKDINHQYKSCILSVSELIEQNKINFVYEEYLKKIEKRNNLFIKDKVAFKIGIAPFSKIKIKEWPLQNYSKVINNLSDKIEMQIFIYGTLEDEEKGKYLIDSIKIEKKNKINYCGKLSPNELNRHIKQINLLICIDSAPMHIACLNSIPVVSVFSQLCPHQFWEPWSANSIILSKRKKCTQQEIKAGFCEMGFSMQTNLIKPYELQEAILKKLNID